MLSALLARSLTPASGRTKVPIVIPWFAVMFIAVVAVNSTGVFPSEAVSAAIEFDTFVLSMAMGALGMTTSFAGFRQVGSIKPLYSCLHGWSSEERC